VRSRQATTRFMFRARRPKRGDSLSCLRPGAGVGCGVFAQELDKTRVIDDAAFVIAIKFAVLAVGQGLENDVQRQLFGIELGALEFEVFLRIRALLRSRQSTTRLG